MLAPTPSHFLSGALLDIRLALEVIAAVFAVRLYRRHHTEPMRLLVYAFLSLAVPHIALFVFAGLTRLAFAQLARFNWIYYADPIAVIAFLVLATLSLRSALRLTSR